jgi:hypothetical protein
MHTEVDLRVVVHGHVDLLLRLCGPAIVGRRVVAGNDLHGLLDGLVAFLLQLLAVAEFACVRAATKVVVLRRWRRRTVSHVSGRCMDKDVSINSPVTVGWHDIVDAQLLADLLDAQMGHVGVQLLGGHGRSDGSRQVHETRRLVVRRISPAIALASLFGAVWVELWLGLDSGLWTAAALHVARWLFRRRGLVVAEAALAQRDGVGTGLSSLSPRHDGDVGRGSE